MKKLLSTPRRIGIGIAAGAIGTIVMTIGQKIEMAFTGRPPSAAPAKAVEELSGVDLATRYDERRAATPIHWAYGTALGGLLAGLDRAPEPARTGLFFASAWGGGAMLLNALGIAPLPNRQKTGAVMTDVGHHAIYAISAGAAYAVFRDFAEGTVPAGKVAR